MDKKIETPRTEKKIYTISEINRLVKLSLEENYSNIWLLGEISNFKTSPPGHYYFTLKDSHSQLRAVMFRSWNQTLRFIPEDGLMVEVRGTLTLYEPRGEYQIIIDYMQPKGIGSLQLAFEQLKEKLQKEGLFDSQNKIPVPVLPHKIGIITSPRGAAIRDILQIINRRFPNVNILIYPTLVQGNEAANQISEAIEYMNKYSDVDVLIITRGGGSLEDLWPFNEEIVARSIFRSKIPIISAVGHEIDFTISDFVADVRAPTPSAAAELVIKNKVELEDKLSLQSNRLINAFRYTIQTFSNILQSLKYHRALQKPIDTITQKQQYIDEIAWKLKDSINLLLNDSSKNVITLKGCLAQYIPRAKIRESSQKVDHLNIIMQEKTRWNIAFNKNLVNPLANKLETLHPRAILERGYSICTHKDNPLPLKKADQVKLNEEVKVILSAGTLDCKVKKISSQ
jgi:exodeoxyribonuclease VII large subunit